MLRYLPVGGALRLQHLPAAFWIQIIVESKAKAAMPLSVGVDKSQSHILYIWIVWWI